MKIRVFAAPLAGALLAAVVSTASAQTVNVVSLFHAVIVRVPWISTYCVLVQ